MTKRNGSRGEAEHLARELETAAAENERLRSAMHELKVYQEELAQQAQELGLAQERIEQSRDRYADLFDKAPLAYVTTDAAGIVEEINLTGAELFGAERARIVGTPLSAFVTGTDRRVLLEHLRRCREGGGLVQTELVIASRGGRDVPVELSSRPERGHPARFRTVLFDLSDRRRLEEERSRALLERERFEASVRARDAFLAVLSHELRTPLTPVVAAVSACAEDERLPEDWRSMFAMLCRNLELETRMIDDLLDVTRIERGKLRLELSTVDLAEVVRGVLALLAEEVERSGLELEVDLGARAHHVRGDPMRLAQVVWNLLNNAIRFTPAPGRITISCRDIGGSVRVSVRDSGIGLDSDMLARVFLPFEQATREHDAAGRPSGLGLGLSICRGVVEAHGGTVHVSSAGPGQGTSFTFELPAVAAPAPRHAETAPRRRGGAEPRGRRILLVEDHKDSAWLLARLLGGEGYEVAVAESVARARELAAQGFDLLISDIDLPDGDGWSLAGELGVGREVEGIAFSGFCSDADLEKSREAGFREHLAKPLDFRRLRATVERALARGSSEPSESASLPAAG